MNDRYRVEPRTGFEQRWIVVRYRPGTHLRFTVSEHYTRAAARAARKAHIAARSLAAA